MRIETTENNIKLIEPYSEKGQWAVRWDFKAKPNTEGIYWYEEEIYNFIPTIGDIQQTIINWFNKQTDGMIKHGFEWKGIKVLLNDENKFNYKAITDETARRENIVRIWDNEHPDLAGVNFTYSDGVDENGNIIQMPIPTGRPMSLLPVVLKLGETNLPESFYTFETLEELQKFFSAGVDHLISAYGAGWYKISTFDWTPYVEALNNL